MAISHISLWKNTIFRIVFNTLCNFPFLSFTPLRIQQFSIFCNLFYSISYQPFTCNLDNRSAIHKVCNSSEITIITWNTKLSEFDWLEDDSGYPSADIDQNARWKRPEQWPFPQRFMNGQELLSPLPEIMVIGIILSVSHSMTSWLDCWPWTFGEFWYCLTTGALTLCLPSRASLKGSQYTIRERSKSSPSGDSGRIFRAVVNFNLFCI
jgi:hypothetical protein